MSRSRYRVRPARRARGPRPGVRPLVYLLAAFAVTSCQKAPLGPRADLLGVSHISTEPSVYFLPPIAKAGTYSGTFDPSADVEVHICEWAADACVDPELAVFTMTTGKGSEIVRVELGEEQYIVNWHTRSFDLDPAKTYRVRIMVGGDELAHADVRVASSGQDLRTLREEGYVALQANATLPIKVRIEDAAFAAAPASATAAGPPPLGLNVLHGCAVTQAGAAYCWGYNNYGELGTGSTSFYEASPVPVTGGHVFTQVATGYLSTCGLDDAGQAWCWGYGSAGDLGNGTNTFQVSAPVAVAGGHTFTQLVAGMFHVCGLTSDGSAYCWGGNAYGALGDGTFVSANVPTPVSGSLTFSELAAGPWNSCGLVSAGGVSCWGENRYGQLGTGSITTSGSPGLSSPQAVVAGTETARAVTTGEYTCVLLASGDATCWGANNLGQLGRGTVDAYELSPDTVAGAHTFSTLSSNGDHACSLDGSGTGWCWGDNEYGQLGIGSQTPDHEATPVQVQGGPWASLVAGGYLTCGILTTGEAECWGLNTLGQAGIGSTATPYVTSPTGLQGGLTFRTP